MPEDFEIELSDIVQGRWTFFIVPVDIRVKDWEDHVKDGSQALLAITTQIKVFLPTIQRVTGRSNTGFW